MTDAGDAFSLEGGGGREQRAGGGEDDAVPFPLAHAPQQISVENGRAAAAAGGSAVHILLLEVIEKKPTVRIALAERHAVAREEVLDNVVPELAQIAGDDQVIILRLRLRIAKQRAERIVGGGGRSQGCTMWKMFSVKFNAYSSPEARRF